MDAVHLARIWYISACGLIIIEKTRLVGNNRMGAAYRQVVIQFASSGLEGLRALGDGRRPRRHPLGQAGHIRITYSDVSSVDPSDDSAGTDDITFSGRDWNYVTDQTAPPNGQSINRFVGGDLYYYGNGFVQHPGDPLHWLRETNPAEIRDVTSVTAPDPGKLLSVLDPAARFVRVGSGIVGGSRSSTCAPPGSATCPG
jgi:hypothetical protein